MVFIVFYTSVLYFSKEIIYSNFYQISIGYGLAIN